MVAIGFPFKSDLSCPEAIGGEGTSSVANENESILSLAKVFLREVSSARYSAAE